MGEAARVGLSCCCSSPLERRGKDVQQRHVLSLPCFPLVTLAKADKRAARRTAAGRPRRGERSESIQCLCVCRNEIACLCATHQIKSFRPQVGARCHHDFQRLVTPAQAGVQCLCFLVQRKSKAFARKRASHFSLLVHCAAGANGEAGPEGERSESRKVTKRNTPRPGHAQRAWRSILPRASGAQAAASHPRARAARGSVSGPGFPDGTSLSHRKSASSMTRPARGPDPARPPLRMRG